MRVIDGQTYDEKSFDDYHWRVKIELETEGNMGLKYNVDIYTTETDKTKIEEVLRNRVVSNVVKFEIVHWATKEQDDLTSEFVNETLEDL